MGVCSYADSNVYVLNVGACGGGVRWGSRECGFVCGQAWGGVRGPIGRIEGSSKLLTVDLSHGRILAPELDSSLVDISEGADLIGTGSRSKRTLDGPGMRGSAKMLGPTRCQENDQG